MKNQNKGNPTLKGDLQARLFQDVPPNDPSHRVHYIGKCPWKLMEGLLVCQSFKPLWKCENKECWETGQAAKNFELFRLSDSEFRKWVMAVISIDPKTIKRLMAKYKDPINPDDYKN